MQMKQRSPGLTTGLSASGFEGSSRAKNFRFNFVRAVVELKIGDSVWCADGCGSYRVGVTRRRVREVARQMTRQEGKKVEHVDA